MTAADPDTADEVEFLLSCGVWPGRVHEHFGIGRDGLLMRLRRAGRQDLIERLRIERLR